MNGYLNTIALQIDAICEIEEIHRFESIFNDLASDAENAIKHDMAQDETIKKLRAEIEELKCRLNTSRLITKEAIIHHKQVEVRDMLAHFGPYCDDDDGISVGDIERWIQAGKP